MYPKGHGIDSHRAWSGKLSSLPGVTQSNITNIIFKCYITLAELVLFDAELI
jgi:hypothetical protein